MALILRMHPGWHQKVVIKHAGERMEIKIKVTPENYKRTELVLIADQGWEFSREEDNT